jgi:hypothetical protein
MCYYHIMTPGIERAWEELRGLEPADVEKRCLVRYEGGAYVVTSLGMDFAIYPDEEKLEGGSPEAEDVVRRYGYFFNHSALWYLVMAKDIPLTGRHIKPQSLRGGEIFFRGSHVLPLEGLARRYADDREGFLGRARALGGKHLGDFGDAAAEVFPLPRLPVTLILWVGDEEFPPRADLLLDSSWELQLPLDIIWSAAMLSVLPML